MQDGAPLHKATIVGDWFIRNLLERWIGRGNSSNIVNGPESSPQVFLVPKTLNFKKKSGGQLSAVAFGSETPLSDNIDTFETFSLQRLTRLLRALISSNYKNEYTILKLFLYRFQIYLHNFSGTVKN